jgi:hypothetical protein
MSQSPDWKAHVQGLADKARPFLARAWSEIRQTAVATWGQVVRLSGFAFGRWRAWDLGRKALAAREALGEALSALGGVAADGLLGLEVIWTPADHDDALTESDLLVTYPHLRSL